MFLEYLSGNFRLAVFDLQEAKLDHQLIFYLRSYFSRYLPHQKIEKKPRKHIHFDASSRLIWKYHEPKRELVKHFKLSAKLTKKSLKITLEDYTDGIIQIKRRISGGNLQESC